MTIIYVLGALLVGLFLGGALESAARRRVLRIMGRTDPTFSEFKQHVRRNGRGLTAAPTTNPFRKPDDKPDARPQS